MNDTPVRKVIRLLLVFYLLSYFLFFLYSIYRFTTTRILSVFMWQYLFNMSMVLFLRYLLPVTVSSVMITYSLTFKIGDLYTKSGLPRPFSEIVSAPLVFFIILTALYIAALEGLNPGAASKLESEKYLSSLAREYREEWQNELDKKQYKEALKYINLYLGIDRANKNILDKREDIRLLALGQETEEKKRTEGEKTKSSSVSLNKADEYIREAEKYFNTEDFFSAHYYSALALEIDPERADAKEIAVRSWEKIKNFAASKKEREEALFFKRKQEGYKALLGGEYIKAYYIFKALKNEKPQDRDVSFYFSESSKKISGISFFLNDAEKALTLPGSDELFFVNRKKGKEIEFVFIKKMVKTEGALYFSGIESLKIDKDGKIVYFFRAPYGKYINQTIVTKCIDRENENIHKESIYIAGNRPREERNIISLNPSPAELEKLHTGYGTLNGMSFAQLWFFRKDFAKYGFPLELIENAILLKLLEPFSFLILSLFGILLGWIFRIRYVSRPPFLAYLVIPVFPVIVFFAVELYTFANRIVLGYVLVSFGFSAALVFLLVLESFLLMLAMVLLAGQLTE
ncbi:MAG: hypothetical protein DRP57_04970 [Spirochaetes bacterium]|nr:MAG: hypothetical protein DRP57_04970 [Spirochaetota bacterium]